MSIELQNVERRNGRICAVAIVNRKSVDISWDDDTPQGGKPTCGGRVKVETDDDDTRELIERADASLRDPLYFQAENRL